MTTVLSIVAGIIIFSLLVIAHEFGHFVMARLTGIGVIEFSLGMGPTLFHIQGKRTRFSLKAVPFGGSCRMIGEDAAGGGEIDINALKGDDKSAGEAESEDETAGAEVGVPADGAESETAADMTAAAQAMNPGTAGEGDEVSEEDDPYTYYGVTYSPAEAFNNKSVWARMLTVVGGPLFNIIFAVILGIILAATSGTNPAIVYSVYEDCGAEAAGLQTGDRIIEFNGHTLSVGREISLLVNLDGLGDTVTLTYERDGEQHTITYDTSYATYMMGISYMADDEPAAITDLTEDGAAAAAGLKDGDIITSIDGTAIATGSDIQKYFSESTIDGSPMVITYTRDGEAFEAELTPKLVTGQTLGFAASYYGEEATFLTALTYGVREAVYGVKCVIYSLRMMFTGQVGLDDLSGPVGIVSVISDTVTQDSAYGLATVMADLLCLAILLSVNLGIGNMFPFPALDGGRFLLLLVEAVTRKKLPPKAENYVNMIGFALLMLLMVVLVISDVIKLF